MASRLFGQDGPITASAAPISFTLRDETICHLARMPAEAYCSIGG